MRRLMVCILTALVFTAGCGPASPDRVRARRVVLLGIDAGTWDVLDPLIDAGLLPNIGRLREGGAYGKLQSIKPSSSPVIWTTIATGKSPEKHGITFFVRFPHGDVGKPEPVTSSMRHGAAIWNILSGRGLDVAIVGWFVTWPVEVLNGRMISDRAHWGALDEHGVFPPTVLAGFEPPTVEEAIAAVPRFMQFDFDPKKLHFDSSDPEERLNWLVFDRFVRAYTRDLFYIRAAEHLLSSGPLPDFLALYLRGTDDVQHGFWKFMDPAPFGDVPADQVQRFGKVIERYWRWIDEQVGNVLARYDLHDTLVVVVSDHGAGPAVGQYKVFTPEYLHLSGSHRDVGILIAHGPGVRSGVEVEGASVYDITPTLLFYLGLPVAADMDGHVLKSMFVDALATQPLQTTPTYDDASVKRPEEHAQPEIDEKALEHLRSLGYIE